MSDSHRFTAEVAPVFQELRGSARAARRFVELFDLFDRLGRGVTVTEICKQFGWPQSSTTDLLNVLFSLGLIYRDEDSREYRPTPRAAMLGSGHQPSFIRDGRLAQLATSLQAKSGLTVALFGRSGLDSQIHLWRPAPDAPVDNALQAGAKFALTDGAAGWLLLSRMTPERRGAVVRAIRARTGVLFPDAVIRAHCERAAQYSRLTGPVSFSSNWRMCGVLTPEDGPAPPFVLALVFPRDACRDTGALAAMLRESVRSGLAIVAQGNAEHRTRLSPLARRHAAKLRSA